jgi:hypothetical protein
MITLAFHECYVHMMYIELLSTKYHLIWVRVWVFKHHFQEYSSYIVAVSFIGGGNRSTRRKPPTCHWQTFVFVNSDNVKNEVKIRENSKKKRILSTRRKSPTCRKSLTKFNTYCCIEYTSPWAGFELTTLVVIGSYTSSYQTIMTTMSPGFFETYYFECIMTFYKSLALWIIMSASVV